MVTPATLPSPARGATDLPAVSPAATKRSDADPASGDDFGETIDHYLGDKTGPKGVRTHTPPAETIEPAPETSDAATILNRANPGVRNHLPPEELADDAAGDTAEEAQPAPEPSEGAKAVRPHAPPTELESSDAAPATTNGPTSSPTKTLASAAASIGMPGFSAKQRVQSLLIDAEKSDGKGPTGKRFSAQG